MKKPSVGKPDKLRVLTEHPELRALMDARNGGDAWDIRCLVRERLIDFLQKNYPGSLPRYRGELEGQGTGTKGTRGRGDEVARERASEGTRSAA